MMWVKLWSEGHKCTQKRHFLSYWKRRHDAQITWPYAYYVTLGSRCKMANSSSEDETDTLPERPSTDTAVSVWACQAGFWKSTGTSCQLRSKPHAVFHGVCEIALTEVLATQMGLMRRSKKVSSQKRSRSAIYYLKVKVALFVPNPMRCFNCNKSGHMRQGCCEVSGLWKRADFGIFLMFKLKRSFHSHLRLCLISLILILHLHKNRSFTLVTLKYTFVCKGKP